MTRRTLLAFLAAALIALGGTYLADRAFEGFGRLSAQRAARQNPAP